MTQAQVAKSTAVVNRFDSPFYPEGSAETWYAKWIAQVLQNPNATGGGRRTRRRNVR